MEISLPDETGRVQILHIHTARMKEFKKISPDVDVKVLNKVDYLLLSIVIFLLYSKQKVSKQLFIL